MHPLTIMNGMDVGYVGGIEMGIRSKYIGGRGVQLWRTKAEIRLGSRYYRNINNSIQINGSQKGKIPS